MTPKLVHPTMPTPSYVACAIYEVQILLFLLYNHNILITFVIGTSMTTSCPFQPHVSFFFEVVFYLLHLSLMGNS
jgi:hypothetical protein